jgi:hypothetical protein
MSWKFTEFSKDGRSLNVTDAWMQNVASTGEIQGRQISGESVAYADSDLAYIKVENNSMANWRPLTIKSGVPFTLQLNTKEDLAKAKVRIVYFINCYINQNFIYLFNSQLREFEATGLLQETDSALYIVFSGTEQDRMTIEDATRKLFGKGTEIHFVHHKENAYEYPGIKKVWGLGREDADGLILYFHARGISRIKLGRFRRNRQLTEKGLFNKVIGEWRQNLLWLRHVPSIDKVGINCGGNGWLWFNFWWVRASYVRQLEEPVKTDRRHYYEDWIGRYVDGTNPAGDSVGKNYPDSKQKCLSIASFPQFQKYNLGSDFNPHAGETNLGLPFGRLRYQISKMKTWLKRGLGKST